MSTLVSAEDSIHFALTWSLVTTRTIFLNPAVYGAEMYTVHIGGHTLSGLPPGLAFFTFGVVSLAEIILPMKPSIVGIFLGTYLSCVFGAIASVVFFKTARMFGSERSSAILTLVFAFGTSLWIYSRLFLPEALGTCLSLAAVYCLLRASEDRAVKVRGVRDVALFAFLSALFLGLSTFVDNMTIFLFVPVFVYLALRKKQRGATIGTRASSLAAFILGAVAGLAPIGYYDYYTTGSALTAPYGSLLLGGLTGTSYNLQFLSGLYAFLVSPESGLVFFTPFILVSLVGLYYFQEERRAEFVLFVGLFLSILVPLSLQSQSTYLHNTVGPSELIYGVPYILIPAISVLNRFRAKSFPALLSYFLGGLSIVITGIVALTAPTISSSSFSFEQGGSSPLVSVNLPLFFGQSYLTWWSFFTYPIIYAMLVLILPIAALFVYSTVSELHLRRRNVSALLNPTRETPAIPKTRTADPPQK